MIYPDMIKIYNKKQLSKMLTACKKMLAIYKDKEDDSYCYFCDCGKELYIVASFNQNFKLEKFVNYCDRCCYCPWVFMTGEKCHKRFEISIFRVRTNYGNVTRQRKIRAKEITLWIEEIKAEIATKSRS